MNTIDVYALLAQVVQGGFMEAIPWKEWYHGVRTFFYVIDAVLLVFLVYILFKALPYGTKLSMFAKRPKRAITLRDEVFREHWQDILTKTETELTENYKLAIIEADALVDDVLKRLQYQGEHMADRLARLSSQDFTSIDRLWKAHRMRNEIAHTPGFTISQEEAKRVLDDYQSFFHEVGLL
ncbi:MAG TPA: hypothetical protein ENH86_02020 [Candidatus Jorgensenbacteria bacterium]|uniref:Uncharacterized protein n=1 Tax=marine sediment metagenome TaxID=412755 RepID=A0A0F9DNR2_9ZZZZ|nr:hypothetical protein [Candidatus Jorgensenbacteria bacterium]